MPPARKPPTSTEVAKAAGVSRTTVSFVLNGVEHQGISAATRERVLAAARELGYTPHAGARRLAGGRSHTIGVLIPRLKHLYVDVFLAQLVAAINDRCRTQGLRLLVEPCGDDAPDADADDARASADRVRGLIRSGAVDGLVAMAGSAPVRQALLEGPEHGVPVVMIGLDLPGLEGLPCVGSDGVAAAQALVGHLLAQGRRRIGFIDYEAHHAGPGERELGWRRALQAAGITPPEAWHTRADITADSGHEAARTLLAGLGAAATPGGGRRRGKPPLDAIFAGNDTIAFGVRRALHEAGWRVPQDIALVGFDDIPLAAYAEPPLTTMRTDAIAHGHAAMDLLTPMLNGQPPPRRRVLLGNTLVVRASCGAGPAAG